MSHAQLFRRSLIVAGLALTLARCRDSFEPGLSARLAVAPVLPSRAELAEFGLTIDAVRFVVVRPISDTLADTTVAIPPGATEIAIDLRVPLLRNPDTVAVSILALGGTTPLFSGSQLVEVPTPLPPPELLVDTYLGPTVDSVVVVPNAPFILLNDSLRFQVLGFNAGAPVSQFYVAWSTSDSNLARIDARGMLRAPGARSTVRVRARTPSGPADSVVATFTPVATQLISIAGAGQIDTVGNALAVPIEVEARAADGLGVGGVTVRFRALAGGSVADSLVVTDAAGRARTAVTLGGAIGLQTFEASASGIATPVTFNATALPGPPSQMVASLGDGQLAVVGSVVSVAPSVVVRDAGGNPVQGVPVTFSVTSGGGSLTGATPTTDASGVATVGSWTVGTTVGQNTLRADAAGLSRSFTASAIAGAASQLIAAAGDLQSAVVGAVLGTDPAVRVQDQFGNPVAGVSVTFAVSGGGGSITGPTQLTNASGVATLGSWTLGTLAGANTLSATVSGLTPLTFTANATAGTATTIVKLAGDSQAATVNTMVSIAPSVRIVDAFGNPVAGVAVTVSLTGGGLVTIPAPVSDSDGIAVVGAWRLGTVVGENSLELSVPGLAGSPASFNATALVDAAAQLTILNGDGQTALVGTAVSPSPSVLVSDQFGNPVAGIGVTFGITQGGGSIGLPTTITSDQAGIATAPTWTLGSLPGTNTLQASASGLTPITFSAEALASLATTIVPSAGDGQTAEVGTALAPYSVSVKDAAGLPVPGVPVAWDVGASGGSISPAVTTTDASGTASAIRTLGTKSGTQTATASVGGLAGSPVLFTATATSGPATQIAIKDGNGQSATVGTAVAIKPSVSLKDQFNNPVAGAAVTFAVLSGGGNVTGGSATTDASGVATVSSWTLGTIAGPNALRATRAGLQPVTFNATGVAGAPTRLAYLTQPIRALAGDTIDPAVQVAIQDQFGNTVFTTNEVVSLTLGVTPSPGAKLVGTTDVAAVSGVATFTDLAIDSAGSGYTLNAGTPKLPGTVETQPFDVGGVIAAFTFDRWQPVAAAVNDVTGRVYVPGLNNNVGVLDPGKSLTMVPGFQTPFGVAVNTRTNMVYVTAASGLVVLNGATDAIVGQPVDIGKDPKGIALDDENDLAFVAITGDAQRGERPSLAIIDTKDTPRLVGSIPFPDGALAGIGVAYNRNDRLVYVAIPNQGLGVFDPAGLKFMTMISIIGDKGAAGTYGVAVDTRANLLYATNRTEGSVSVVDPAGLKELTRLLVGRDPEGVGVDADRAMVYVGNASDGTVSFIDTGKLNVIATLIVGPQPKAAAVDIRNGRFYVPTLTDDRVRAVQP